MKLEVFNGKSETKIPVMVRLQQGEGYVSLIVVNERGEKVLCGTLLSIHDRGVIIRSECVNPELGFHLDLDGRIIIENE